MKNITFIQDNTPAKFIRNRSCNFREEDRQVKSLQMDRQTMLPMMISQFYIKEDDYRSEA